MKLARLAARKRVCFSLSLSSSPGHEGLLNPLGLAGPALSLSLSSSSPGHEGLSNPLGLVGPPDVRGALDGA